MKKRLLILFAMYCYGMALFPQEEAPYYSQGYPYYCNRLADGGEYLWIASNKGLVRYEKASGKCEFYSEKVGASKFATFTCVYVDGENNLWFGTKYDHLYRYDGQQSIRYTSHHFVNNKPESRYSWYSIISRPNGQIAASSDIFYYFYDVNKPDRYQRLGTTQFISRYASHITDMKYDGKGNRYLALDARKSPDFEYHLIYYRESEAGEGVEGIMKGPKTVTSLAVDANNNLWYVCDDGIHYYNSTTKTDTHYDFGNYPDIPEALYTACKIDGKGNVWFVASNYLLKYNGERFTHYTYYALDKARSILCEGDALWIYTDNDELFKFANNEFSWAANIEKELLKSEEDPSGISPTPVKEDLPLFHIACDRNGEIRIRGEREITRVDVYSPSGLLVSSSAFNGQRNVALKNRKLFSANEIYILKIRHDQGETAVKTIVQ